MDYHSSNNKSSLFATSSETVFQLIMLICFSVLLIVVDKQFQLLSKVRMTFHTIATPIHYFAYLPIDISKNIVGFFDEKSQILSENKELKQKLLWMEAESQRFEILKIENARLRALLNTSKNFTEFIINAEIIGLDLDPYRHRFLLDKGTKDGVEVGQTVADANGIMGQVVEVSWYTSFAMLISDLDHAIPIRINRTGITGIVYGTGKTDELSLPYLPISADVQVGDLIITSGLGGRFPAGFPVGVIKKTETASDASYIRAFIEPLAALDSSQHVLLIAKENKLRPLQ